MSSRYVADYKQAEDELTRYGVADAREELRYTLSAYREESPEAGPQAILKEAVRNIKIDVSEERERRERETAQIPRWMDEESITARRYEEGTDLPDWEEKEHTIRIKAW